MHMLKLFLVAAMLLAGLGVLPAVTGHSIALAASPKEEEGPPPEFEYMELSPLSLPIITDAGVTQQVSLVISLEMPYGKRKEVEAMTPRLADAYLQDLYGALGAGHGMMRNNVLDVQAVKDRLTAVTYKVVKQDQVSGVLLQVLQQRRIM